MKKVFLALTTIFFAIHVYSQDTPKNTTVLYVKKICEGLSEADKPAVAIMPFKVSTSGISAEVSTGFPDMLLNAVLNSGCFRVFDRDRLKDIIVEQGLGQSGAGDESTFAQAGKLVGAQVLIIGTITEFNEKAGGSKFGLGGLLPGAGGKIAGAIGGGQTVTSSISYTLKFVNTETGQVLESQSFNKKKTAVGLAGGGLVAGGNGIGGGGGSFFKSKSMQNALESSLVEAVEYMSQNKSAFVELMRQKKQSEAEQPKFDKANCSLINSANSPKIMVIIPEYHISQRIPDPAAETEINRKFIDAGFHVIDPAIYASTNNTIEFKDAANDPARAISIGKKFGADIVIYGEAFSQRPGTVNGNNGGTLNGMVSCRARVEVRAVRTDNAEIIATNGSEAGGVDNAEFVAAKTALTKAGDLMAEYLLVKLCSSNLSFQGTGVSGSSGQPKIEIDVSNAEYSKLRTLATTLSQKYKVLSHSINKDGTGIIIIEVKRDGESQGIADFIDDKAHLSYNIKNVEADKIELTSK